MERRDVASWLQGPKQALEDQGYEFGYRGERLGLPPAGLGAISPMGRRVVALIIDWISSLLVANLIFRGQDVALETLGIFALQTIVLMSFGGGSFGDRLLGIGIVRADGSGAVAIPRVVLRQLLLCLFVPAIIMNRDQRGLHDLAANTVMVRARV